MNNDRINEMLHLYQEGLTQQQIGQRYGVSRQYVQQCLWKHPDYETEYHYRPIKWYDFTCKQCGQIKKAREFNRKYCDRICLAKSWPKRTKEELKAYNAKRCKEYYHRVLKHRLGFSEVIRERNQAYAPKRKLLNAKRK